jgi:hypothetical protein
MTAAAMSKISGQLSAEEYAQRILNIQQKVKDMNQAYQMSALRFLEMSKGAKGPVNSMAQAGLKPASGQ